MVMVLQARGPQEALNLETRVDRMVTGMLKDQRPEENKAGLMCTRKKSPNGRMISMQRELRWRKVLSSGKKDPKEVKFHYLKFYSDAKIHTRNLEVLGFLEKTDQSRWIAKRTIFILAMTRK